MTIEKEWQIFSLGSYFSGLSTTLKIEPKPGQTRREAVKEYFLKIFRVIDQGPIDDPCDPEWTQFARDFRSGPEWIKMLRECREFYRQGGRLLDSDLSWSLLFDENGKLNNQ